MAMNPTTNRDNHGINVGTQRFCATHGHYWITRHSPQSVPTDYKRCERCQIIDCSDAISHLLEETEDKARETFEKMLPIYEQEARKDELESLLKTHHSLWIVEGAVPGIAAKVIHDRLAQIGGGTE
jgi:hypothetical protein